MQQARTLIYTGIMINIYNPRWEKILENSFTVMELLLREELPSPGHTFSYNSV